ncbi:alpha/beta hydrolase [Undibacterium sp. RTI2.2]|uniref:alpha/beta fold hydrolase n=2 Tax=unclassified Undibacterium TaxID=2630295 RepID=UPI002AB5CD71|nr:MULTISPECIES: alpha/beta hydrolase [unclassified Undibacterium]MDY7538407.1 alpha/beta hydrolase [Undibacterium sp. 5I1]MEB0114969.1 alpha/beta hydrolase [Undibacterium sp. RTI2.2]MEB0230691.1 alpha/beta hydrolase [Undibacterium sp. 10I3]MEB0255928.1 alpha/beta hydrolase [Undibacterium sp. 5I1]
MIALRKSVQCVSPAGLHRMSYKQWGDPLNPRVLVCVHGLSRVADDFDALAEVMSDTYRVVCPDVVGRGQSDWLRNPQFYQVPQYVSDMVTLVARLDVETVDWFGTSMGGLIGMGLAAMPESPIRKLILNDVGPVLNPAALVRIGDYIGQDVRFNTFEEAAAYIKQVSISFGPHTDAQWHKLATDVLKQNQDGQWIRHYDLGLAAPIKATTPEIALAGQGMLWAAYDAIKCQTLVVRGSESDLLSEQTAQEMTQRGPRAAVVEIPGVGHAPTFVQPEQIAIAREFFLA